ncbi:MAG TPA: chemotaxis response regulator protein-glutamate methylesterase [Porticoccaceae bacterium]|nr:chemotaxis response regulator protein-glutamate methylesterase [Porticoccaceae bacterium]HCO61433.1 chemotaxis response regulator protein-glutamate methylesterase [Porticoccaceae bacterium]
MYRQLLRELIDEVPGLECIGTAENGRDALDKIECLEPEVTTLDLEMPVLDGIEVIEGVKQQGSKTSILLVSAYSKAGAKLTVRALEAGAYDFITKPQGLGPAQARQEIRRQLKHKLCNTDQFMRPIRKVAETSVPLIRRPLFRPQALTIGCSTGGPIALLRFMKNFQQPLGVPVFVAQHMPPLFTKTLAESLDKVSSLKVKEAEHGEQVQTNHTYIAPGGRQLEVVGTPGAATIEISDYEGENEFKPSVDILFTSVAQVYRDRVMAFILSGMGSDGTRGLQRLKNEGAMTIGQEENSCVVYGMPKSARLAGVVDAEMTLDQMTELSLDILNVSPVVDKRQ